MYVRLPVCVFQRKFVSKFKHFFKWLVAVKIQKNNFSIPLGPLDGKSSTLRNACPCLACSPTDSVPSSVVDIKPTFNVCM